MERAARSERLAPAHAVFFLLACTQAMLAVPLWVAELFGGLPPCTACVPSLRHAHEMLLGYGVAVLGGFLFTRLTWPRLAAAMIAWLAGRIAGFADATPVTAAAALAFPAMLAVLAGWPFLKTARTPRNLAFAPVLFGFLAAEALYQGGRLGVVAAGQGRGLSLALDMILTMLLVMGGRLIPAAMAGMLRSRGDAMADRNGPRLELATLAAMAVAATGHLAGLDAVALAGWAAAGIAGAIRLRRWRFGAALAMPSLWPLQVGYGVLCGGLMMGALAGWTGWWDAVAVLHGATIGGFGVLSLSMMVRTMMLRERLSQVYPRAAIGAVFLLLAAAGARMASPLAPPVLIPAAMVAWSAAFALGGWTVLGLYRAGRAAARRR